MAAARIITVDAKKDGTAPALVLTLVLLDAAGDAINPLTVYDAYKIAAQVGLDGEPLKIDDAPIEVTGVADADEVTFTFDTDQTAALAETGYYLHVAARSGTDLAWGQYLRVERRTISADAEATTQPRRFELTLDDSGTITGVQGVGIQGPAGQDGADGVAAASAPLTYDAGTRTIGIDTSDLGGLKMRAADTSRAWSADDAGKVVELGAGVDLSGLDNLAENDTAFVLNPTVAARVIGQDSGANDIEVQAGELVLVLRTGASTAQVFSLGTPLGTYTL